MKQDRKADRAAYKKAWYEANRERLKLYHKAYNEKNRDRNNARNKAYLEKNRERMEAWRKTWRAENRDRIRKINRRSHLKRQYGLPEEQFNLIFESQGRKCAICKTLDFGKRGPIVDHCHAAGHVRGILCHGCNTMIGWARNSTEIMSSAVDYLSKELIFNAA